MAKYHFLGMTKTFALMNSQQLWLPARDLHKNKTVNTWWRWVEVKWGAIDS